MNRLSNNLWLFLVGVGVILWSSPVTALQDEAQEQKAAAPQDETFEDISEEFSKEMRAFQQSAAAEAQKAIEDYEKALEEATDEEREALMKKGMPPMKMADPRKAPFVMGYLDRVTEYVERNPTAEDVPTALTFIFAFANPRDEAKKAAWDLGVKMISENFIDNEAIERVLPTFAFAGNSEGASVLRKVAESSKSRINQALAIKSLINLNERMSQMADMMDDEAFRKAMMEEGQLTEADIKEMVANGDARAKETVVLKDRLKKDFSDIFPDLSIGQPAPETVGHDLDGNEDRLSGYKGKVVVLDVWTTWCGPCRQMIPHEREMVERLSGKPFALISVSMDDEQEALTEFLKENEMPWKHWWCGGDRSFSLKWDIQYFPTIYVIDATGKIRFKDVREEKLEEAVNELLEEIEQGESGDSAGNDG